MFPLFITATFVLSFHEKKKWAVQFSRALIFMQLLQVHVMIQMWTEHLIICIKGFTVFQRCTAENVSSTLHSKVVSGVLRTNLISMSHHIEK